MEVLKNQEFLMLPADEVGKLLASDDLNVPSEEVIFRVSQGYSYPNMGGIRKSFGGGG